MTYWTCFRCMTEHEVINGLVQCPKVDEPYKGILNQEEWEVLMRWLRSTSNPLNHI